MKKSKGIKVLGTLMGITLMVGGATVCAGTSYSSSSTVTVGKFNAICPSHPSMQTKAITGEDGHIVVSNVGGNYEVHCCMTQKDLNGYWMDDGKKISISTGDKKTLPSKDSHTKGSDTVCFFNTSITTYVDVNCTSKWKSN